MSQENVQLTYRSHDAFNRRDLDAYLSLLEAVGLSAQDAYADSE